MDYLDFELEIGAGSGREYPVVVVNSPAGQAHETMHFPFDELVLENRLLALHNALLRSGGKHRQMLSSEEQTVQDFGQTLFESLFTRQVYSLYEMSRLVAGDQDKGLRLKLRIQPPGLAALPWEFLYDPDQGEYLCLSSSTPIVRYPELPQPPHPLLVTLPLSILGMIASPKDLAGLDVEREKQRVEKAIEDLQVHGQVKLTWLRGRTWRDLQRAMYQGHWHIFHFIGHGGFNSNMDEGLLALEDEKGQADYLRATQLARLLADHRALRLVLLNSCEGARSSEYDIFSSTAAILVRRGIPAVLAMQYEITDRAAIELSRAFYEALADGMPVDTAVAVARKAISIAVTNSLEWGTPVLYMRSPDGILFRVKSETFPSPSHNGSAIATLAVSSPHTSVLPLIQPSLEEGLSSPGKEQASINQESPATQITPEAIGISSFEEGQTASPQISPEEAPASNSTIPPTKAILTLDSPVEPAPIEGKVKAFTLIHTLTGHSRRVESVAISPDGRMLASGSADQTVKLWNLQTGELLQTLKEDSSQAILGGVWSVAISPDGQTLACGSNDHTIRIWEKK